MFSTKAKDDSSKRKILLEENKTSLDLVAENGEDDIDKQSFKEFKSKSSFGFYAEALKEKYDSKLQRGDNLNLQIQKRSTINQKHFTSGGGDIVQRG